MRTRIIAVALIKNEKDEYLLLKMPENFGAYPGKWGIVGGGLEDGEVIEDAVKREVQEEVELEAISVKPLIFDSDRRMKILRDGSQEDQYMIFLLHEVIAKGEVNLNDEWETFAWVTKSELSRYDLNNPTKENFQRLGLLELKVPTA